MEDGEVYSRELSVCIGALRGAHRALADDGTTTVLKEKMPLEAGEVLNGSFKDFGLFRDLYEKCTQEPQESGALFSYP